MKPAPSPRPKARLVFEELTRTQSNELLVRAELPKSIELRVDGVAIWWMDGRDLLKRPKWEARLCLRAVALTDDQVAAMEQD